ncbi:MAG TPA: 6-phosphogluconolactonase [Bryobacteraceae bacterium]|nr:6-phosphogluconolactonase [Bryobacteraceae bacterium]
MAQPFVFENAQGASEACAGKILELLGQALATQPRASLAISGGSTPKLMFAVMAKANFDWSRVHLFWVDERVVPPTDSQSNYRLAKEHFIDPSHFPLQNVHRVEGELPAKEAAKRYEDDIRGFFGSVPGAIPQFDVVHRGIGPDAHTASLFPGEPAIDDHKNLVAAVYVEKFQQWRVTLLPAVLEAARNTLMLAAGDDKAEPLKEVMRGAYDPKKYPAQIGTYDGHDVLWFLDKAAARLVG